MRICRRKMFLVLFVSVINSGISQLYSQDNLPPGTSIHMLDNGMEILMVENRLLPMVGINVVVKTGSAYESFTTSGMSHMLEHLLFNGTATRTQKELYDAVDLIGGYNNANTSYFYTNFMMVTPRENIVKGMEIQADMLFNSILPEEKFAKEKGIVLEEIAQNLGKPASQIENNLNRIVFEGHAMSLPVLGTYSTIENMTRDQVYTYYKNKYVPNNMSINIIGNFQPDSMLVSVKDIFGKIPPSDIKQSKQSMLKTGLEKRSSDPKAKIDMYHRFYSGEDVILHLIYDLPAHFNSVHGELLAEFFRSRGDELKSGLQSQFKALKSVEFSTDTNPIRNFLQVRITLRDNQSVRDIIKNTYLYLSRLQFQLASETINWLATRAKTDLLKNLEKPHMFGIYNAGLLAVQGAEAVFKSYAAGSYKLAMKDLAELDLDSEPTAVVHRVISNNTIQQGTKEPGDKIHSDPNSGITVLARQNQGSELIAIHYLFKHKANFEKDFGENAAKYLHECFGQRLKSVENQRIIQNYGLDFKVNDNPYIPMDNIYLHPDFSYIRIEGLANDLPGLVNFLNRELFNFSPTQEEWDWAKSELKKSARMMAMRKGEHQFEQIYKNIIYEPERFEPAAEPEDLGNIQTFADAYFSPENTVISVVAPAEPDSIIRLFILGLQATDYDQSVKKAYQRELRLLSEPLENISEAGGEQSYLFWGFTKRVLPEDRAALLALSLVLKDTIIFEIREKQGRAYRLSAGIEQTNDKVLFFIRLGTRPENIDPLKVQMPDFFSQNMTTNLTTMKLNKTINMYLGRMMFRRLSSINQAYYLSHSYYFYNDMYYDQNILEELKNIGIKDVLYAAEKYLIPENTVTVIVR